MTNAGKLVFGVSGSGFKTLESPKAYNDGTWHQAVATQGPTGMRLYVDGHLLKSNTVTKSESSSGYWRVGGDSLAGWPSRPTSDFFKGDLDETAVYPGVLSAARVAGHYTLGKSAG